MLKKYIKLIIFLGIACSVSFYVEDDGLKHIMHLNKFLLCCKMTLSRFFETRESKFMIDTLLAGVSHIAKAIKKSNPVEGGEKSEEDDVSAEDGLLTEDEVEMVSSAITLYANKFKKFRDVMQKSTDPAKTLRDQKLTSLRLLQSNFSLIAKFITRKVDENNLPFPYVGPLLLFIDKYGYEGFRKVEPGLLKTEACKMFTLIEEIITLLIDNVVENGLREALLGQENVMDV